MAVEIIKADDTEEEFKWILAEFNDKEPNRLLGRPYPTGIRKALYKGHMLTTPDRLGFCFFSPPNTYPFVTVWGIFVKEEARGKHVATAFLEYLYDTYLVPVRATCEANTSADLFWAKQGVKIEEKVSKHSVLLYVYECGTNRLHEDKVPLF